MKYLLLILSYLVSQSIMAQCTIRVVQEGKKCARMEQFVVYNYHVINNVKINDSTTEYSYQLESPAYLYIRIDTVGQRKRMNWTVRMWMAPGIKERELILNYDNNTARIVDEPKQSVKGVNECFYMWDSITEATDKLRYSKGAQESDSAMISYVNAHLGSYLSLWFFDHSSLGKLEKGQKQDLFNKLSSTLSGYKEYKQIKADMTERRSPAIGEPFKEFTLEDKKGGVFSTKKVKNKWILLHFWADFCGPCVKGMDKMVAYYKTLDTSKIAFISVSLDYDIKAWKDSKNSAKIPWYSVWEDNDVFSDLCLNYNVNAIPFYVLFNPQKKLVALDGGEGADEIMIKNNMK